MRLLLRAAALVTLAASTLSGQGQVSLFAAPNGSGDPATCRISDIFYNSSATQLKVCTAPNTWTALATGGVTAFNTITGGTNTIPAHMTVGNGSLLDFTGTGQVYASGWRQGDGSHGIEVTSDLCGMVGDGATDNYTALKNCLTGVSFAISARGLVLVLQPGIYNVDLTGGRSQIVINKDNVRLRGPGGFTSTDLCYPGSTSGACLSNAVIRAVGSGWGGNYVLTWDGTGTTRGFLDGPALEGVDIDGNNLAAGGVRLKYFNGASVQNSSIHDWVGTSNTSWGLDLTSGSAQAVGTCGQGGGLSVFHNLNVQSYRGTGANGIRVGDPATVATTDVCSMKFSNIFVANNNPPGNHSIHVANSDSDQFVNIQAAGFSGVGGTNTLLATSATTATLTVPSHNLAPGATNDGIFLVYVCSSNSFGGNNDCSSSNLNVLGLQGTLTAAYISSTQIGISGAYGLTNGATYFVRGVHGADLELGTVNTANMFSQILTNYGIHNPGNTFNLVTGWNWGETIGQNPTYSKPGGNVFPVLGTDGSLWGMTVRTALPVQPIGDFPNHLITIDSSRATGGKVPDFYQVIDLTGLTPTTSSGYYGVMLANGSAIGGIRSTGAQMSLLGVDASNNLNLGTGGAFGAIHVGQGGLTTQVSGTLQLPSLTASLCLALDGSGNVISQSCGGGGGSAWASLTPGTNTTAGTFAFSSGNIFSVAGTSTAVLNGASGNTAKIQITGDFSAGPTTGAAAQYITMVFPSAAVRGASLEYHGTHYLVSDPAFNLSCGDCIFNTGMGNSFYTSIYGSASAGSSTAGSISGIATGTPTTITSSSTLTMQGTFFVLISGVSGGGCSGLNGSQGGLWTGTTTFTINVTTSGSCSGGTWTLEPAPFGYAMDMNGDTLHHNWNANYVGRGITIDDWSTSEPSAEPNGEIPIFVYKHSTAGASANPAVKIRNDAGADYFDLVAGAGSDQVEELRFLNFNGVRLWELGKDAANAFRLVDTQNSRNIWSATAGGRLKADQGLLLPNGSGALQILDSGAAAQNVMSVSGSGSSSITSLGTKLQLDVFSNSGLAFSVLDQGGIRMPNLTVGTLPACGGGTDNAVYAVSNQSNAAVNFGDAATAGGSAHVLVHCNGVGWTVMAR